MPKYIDLKQGSSEWKSWRRWKIGASMVPAIMEVSPWQTKLQLWESIVLAEDKEPNYAMQRGTKLEEKSRELFNKSHNLPLDFKPGCFEHSIFPWMIVSLDGAIWLEPNLSASLTEVLSAIEIKCPGIEAHSMALHGEVPYYYWPQLQYQMYVCGLNEMTYISFDGEKNVEILVKRDDEYINSKMIASVNEFYASLLDFKPPEPSGMDSVVIHDPGIILMANRYLQLQDDIKSLQDECDAIKEQLVSKAVHGRCQVGDLKMTKVIRKGSVDYSKIEALKSIDLEKYRKEPIISWRFSGV